MIKIKKQSKKQLRQNIIYYFLAMSRGHELIQQLQQQLILHPYFNPIILFKKISQGKNSMSRAEYMNYLRSKIPMISHEGVQVYMRRYGFENKIQCEQFISSFIPYTPDVLRNTLATIVWQVKSSPNLQKDTEKLLKDIIKTQVYHIQNVSSFRKRIKLSWQQLKSLIFTDLKNYNITMQIPWIQKQFNMITIRKWMEIWIETNEKDILNIMRWMKGGDQQSIFQNFLHLYVIDSNCTCHWTDSQEIIIKQQKPEESKERKFLRQHSLRPVSRQQQEMFQRKISIIQKNPIPFQHTSRKQSINKASTSSRSRTATRKQSFVSSYRESKHQNQNQQQKQIYMDLWNQYIDTILSGQSCLSQKRIKIQTYLDQIKKQLKKSVINVKTGITRISKIIEFIDKYCKISKAQKKIMEQTLSSLSIENQVILSIFGDQTWQNIISQGINQQKIKIPTKQLKKQIAETLKNYCLTKSKLISVSKQITIHKFQQKIFKYLCGNNQYLISQTLSQKLNEMCKNVNFSEIEVLLKHFGDGETINLTSFCRVFQIQSI